jgi:hypothetical protein
VVAKKAHKASLGPKVSKGFKAFQVLRAYQAKLVYKGQEVYKGLLVKIVNHQNNAVKELMFRFTAMSTKHCHLVDLLY